MSKSQWKAIALSLLFALSLTWLSIGFLVFPQKSLAQITSIGELSDVSPTDWYFQPLQALTETYGIFNAYSDRTFRADRPSTRAEMAVLMNSALGVLSNLSSNNGVYPEDLASIQHLQDELAKELQGLRDRQEAAEQDLIDLRSQFSQF